MYKYEKFSLKKASAEAEKMRQKVSSREAASYEEAEKILEREALIEQEAQITKEKTFEFDSDEFLSNLRNKITAANEFADIVRILKEAILVQKDRQDLIFLFENYRFIVNVKEKRVEKYIDIENFYKTEAKEVDENLNSEKAKKEIENTPLDKLKEMLLSDIGHDGPLPPKLQFEDDKKSLEMFEDINEKISVDSFHLSSFIEFLNTFKGYYEKKSDLLNYIILGDGTTSKKDFFDVQSSFEAVLENPEILKKIDYIDKVDLENKLKLLGSNTGKYSHNPLISFLKDVPLEALKLIKENNYFTITPGKYNGYNDASLITENRLEEISEFFENLENFKLCEVGSLICTTKEGEEIKAKESFYPILFGENRYTDILGFKAQKMK